MIKYRLICSEMHEFEGWFQSIAAFDEQAAQGQVSCPRCGASKVEKAIMAPNVATRSTELAGPPSGPETFPAHELHHLMRELREQVRNAEYVGPRFAEEARKIHLEETPARGIYGEASIEDAKALAEDGIPFLPLPRLPEDCN